MTFEVDATTTPAPTEEPVRHKVPRVPHSIASAPWAITEEALDQIVSIASRENEISQEALEAYQARKAANGDRLQVRAGVGIITVSGPLFRYADMFSAISGASTYEGIARDLTVARDDPSIQAILVNLDSPGGEVNGCSELANMIRSYAGVKPIEAYVGGMACSAAYWLASACSKITISPTAVLGSIGVRMGIRDSSERDAKSGVKNIEFISSRAPNKRTDWNSDEGKARIQRMADQLEAVFVADVAKFRGITDDEVVSNYGGGGVEIGTDAIKAGLADAIGSFESTVERMAAGKTSTVRGSKMTQFTQAQLDAARAEGEAAGRSTASTDAATAAATAATQAATARIEAILALDESKDRPAMARHLAFKTDMSVDAAKAMLAVAGKETAAAQAPTNRSKDAAGGLATATLTEVGAENGTEGNEQPLPPAKIDAGAIFARREKAMQPKGSVPTIN